MAGLVPAIHGLFHRDGTAVVRARNNNKKVVDGRHKAGHDDLRE
jgi:hypothetical protein